MVGRKLLKGDKIMTHDQIQKYRLKLTDIITGKPPYENTHTSLEELAKEVGASTTNKSKGHGKASIPELVDNINDALRTESMIETCRIATENYEIAVTATKATVKNYWIAAAIAILSMLAAWVAVLIR